MRKLQEMLTVSVQNLNNDNEITNTNTNSSHCVGLAFCDPVEEFIEIVAKVPPELLKVFRISQLTIRYLLKSQEMLTVSVQNLNNDNEITHKELAKMAKKMLEATQQIKDLKTERKRLKQTVKSQHEVRTLRPISS